MKIHKTIVVVVTIVMFGGSSMIAQAWWGDWLYPGAAVFDAKRFADSVQETEQAIAAVQNAWENLNNRMRLLATVNSQFNCAFEAVQGSGNIPKGKNVAELSAIQRQAKESAERNEPYELILASSLEEANQHVAGAAQQVFQNRQLRETAQQEIIDAATMGVVGEWQKKNATVILEALEGMELAQVKGAQFMQKVTLQEAQYTTKRIEQEKAKSGEFYGYDPYHPNEYDVNKRVVLTKSLGFMKYGE